MILVLKILDKNSSFSPLSVCLFLIANSWLYVHLVHFPYVCLSVYPSLSVCLSLSPSFLIDILLLSLRLVFFILFLEFLDNRRCVNLFSQALFLKSCLTASFFLSSCKNFTTLLFAFKLNLPAIEICRSRREGADFFFIFTEG